jgi:membrane-associated protease RseP (regulator of RpoE activity)
MQDFAKYAAEELRVARGQSRILSKQTSALMKEVSGFTEGRTLLGGAGAFTAGITLWPSLDCAAVVGVNAGGGEQLCEQVSQAVERMFVEDKPFALVGETKPQGYGFGLALAPDGGVVVRGVAAGSIAAQEGLANGDQIIEMNGEPIAKIADERRFAALRGDPLTLKVNRQGRFVVVKMAMRSGNKVAKALDKRPESALRRESRP